jgi:phosphoribosylglycinamide formyltransferase-1
MITVAFTYDMPHKKSYEGLCSLAFAGRKPDVVIGAPPVKLTFPTSEHRITPRGLSVPHPEDVCRYLGIPYVVSPHADELALFAIKNRKADLGIVLGARILRRPTIESFEIGILNMHPGILPGNRGLDNLKWSILNDLPVGVTAHLIDTKVDRGRLICQDTVPIYEDDTIRDVFLRQQDLERKLMHESIRQLEYTPDPQNYVPLGKGTYYKAVPPLFESGLAEAWERYRGKHGRK